MSPLVIPAHERGVIRLFALSMTDEEAKALEADPDALNAALGVPALDHAHVELFPVSDLEGVGLAGFLAEGGGVPEAELAADRGKLDKLGGWVLVLYSGAFEGRETTLRPVAMLTLIGTYGSPTPDWRAKEKVEAETAKPFTAPPETVKKRPSDAAMSGRIAMLVLILLGLFTYVFIWIAS